ncbi:glycosyltransferase [Kaistella montana]|uniref:Glycosyltransferase n=1 Tax=Kaistella montana TaxID=1849733 RepID=A0ABW5KAW2_9FLAO|nr:glycosyltransferase [Kaistella montana]MCQ4035399.1 glycosyltransferase [Kaistella montana]
MKILHTVSSFGKESYGLGSISMGIAKAQFELGEDVYVWSSDTKDDIVWASQLYDFPQERLLGFPPNIPLLKISSSELREALRNKSFDIVHQHSLWTSKSLVTSLLNKNGAKTCIAAHGTLSEFALKKSKFKKEIALALFERNNLNKVSVLHATSEYEIEDYKRIGLENPIAYIDNGVGTTIMLEKGDGEAFKSNYQLPSDKKILLYLSRITPKKGLDMLLPAIAELKEHFDDWILVIVGNDEFNYQLEVEKIVKELNLENKIFIIEPQYGKDKFNAFDAADFFILPSYSEGSPMVVVDALAYGLPVITTKSSSWKDLNENKCGYWVDINKDAIKQSLLRMIALNDHQLFEYGENAKKLVIDKYLWNEISKKTILLYNWMINKDLKPDFIY